MRRVLALCALVLAASFAASAVPSFARQTALDCNSCHLIVAQGSGEALQQINAKGYEFVHIDAPYTEFSCTDCHTGGVQK